MSALSDVQRAQAERDRQEAIYNRTVEYRTIAEYAREFVAATQAYESDRYSLGWCERATRAHLARAALWGSCGYVEETESDES